MKYSIAFAAWLITMFITYLAFSGAASIIGGYSYREVLCSTNQIGALIFIYWWLPALFVGLEIHEKLDD